MNKPKLQKFLFAAILALASSLSLAEVTRIEVTDEETLSDSAVDFSYTRISGVVYFTLDPNDPNNAAVTDIQYAPTNNDGLVEYSADFKLVVPDDSVANGGLLYMVNNRGRGGTPPESSLQDPLSGLGYTYLLTGWINEIIESPTGLRLHAPIVGSLQDPITGDVRYEVSVTQAANDVNIAGGGHLAYEPSAEGLASASLSERLYLSDPRVPIERSQFDLTVSDSPNSNQKEIVLNVDGGFKPGYIYELIYEAKNPVLAGAGMSGIRDLVSLIRYGGAGSDQLAQLDLPEIEHTVAYGFSQSGRLLRQYMYDGFNADLEQRQVFDGVVPFIAGGGYGMFNNRFAMPTRTNGQHSNHLFPNDLFPFTYGDSTDPFTGRTDGILRKARESSTEPKVMHIQTSNEYWIRAGSLPHTNPEGTEDAVLPDGVRFYTIGGSQHGSGNGIPRTATSGQLPPNPGMWNPIGMSLVVAMYDWVAEGKEPPASRYPRIEDDSLVASHVDDRINRAAWNRLNGVNHPSAIYKPSHNNYGSRWDEERIIDEHPTASDHLYNALVPAVGADNNDLGHSTILPPATAVPLATFTSWNLRAPATGAERSLARLAGGYIPYAKDTVTALANRDQRNSIAGLYRNYDDYLEKYEAATDQLIEEGYLLAGFKEAYINIAHAMASVFE
ncbi:MAG: alpha/beta hydrolase domain-containing protein [Gammaproteobacteria bacterium]|nr:alpha/beta hydrolase domain-containing protein [Gammaproteobacteria bacterium]